MGSVDFFSCFELMGCLYYFEIRNVFFYFVIIWVVLCSMIFYDIKKFFVL